MERHPQAWRDSERERYRDRDTGSRENGGGEKRHGDMNTPNTPRPPPQYEGPGDGDREDETGGDRRMGKGDGGDRLHRDGGGRGPPKGKDTSKQGRENQKEANL